MADQTGSPGGFFSATRGGDRPPDGYEAVLNALDDACCRFDAEGEVVAVNDAFVETTGRDRAALVGTSLSTVTDESAAIERAARSLFDADAEAETLEVTFRTAADERFDVDLRVVPLAVDGAFAGGVVVADGPDDDGSEDSERQFRSLVDAVEEYAIFMLDPEGNVTTWNEGAERIKGYAADDIVGEHFSTFYTADDREAGAPEENLSKADAAGSVEDTGWRVREDGSRFWARVTITAIRDDEGDLDGFVKVTRDMTERREYEEQLRRERDLSERVIEAAPASIVVLDADGSLARANERAERRLGIGDEAYSLGEIDVYDEDGNFVPAEERPYVRAFETGESVTDWLCRMEVPEGELWVSINATPITEDGEVTRVVVTGQDVTEMKDRAAAFQRRAVELESELDDVFSRIDDAFFALDEDWRFTYLNEQAERMLERSAEDLLGTNVWSSFPGAADSTFEREYRRAMERQEPTTFEEYFPPLNTWFEVRVYPDESGLSVYFRDVTERKWRERKLEESERRYRTLAERFPNGVVTLFDDDMRYTLAAGRGFDDLPVDPDDVEGRTPTEVWGEDVGDDLESLLRAALAGEDATLELSYAGREWVVHAVPITDAAGDVFSGMTMAQDITEQKERERELERQRERLAALNSLNGVVRGITEAVIEQSTREEIERVVCERLADTDSFEFAWLGEVDAHSQTVRLREEAGVDGYLDDIDLTVDPNDPRSQGPTGQAFLTNELQVSRSVYADPDYDYADGEVDWRDRADEYGYRASAAIPIVHEGSTYGVLNVYANRENAFAAEERGMLRQLGEVVGHAIAAVERTRALTSDEVVRLDFRIDDVLSDVGVPTATDRIELNHTVTVADDEFLVYGRTTEAGLDVVEAVVDAVPHWSSVNVVGDGEEIRFEARLTEPPVLTAVAEHGGYVQEAAIDGGDYVMTVYLPVDSDPRRIQDVVQEAYPSATVVTKRQISRADDPNVDFRAALDAELTDRQRTVLESAYFAGYFEWPRANEGVEIADSLDISGPTFSQHLRAAERKVFGTLFDDRPPA